MPTTGHHHFTSQRVTLDTTNSTRTVAALMCGRCYNALNLHPLLDEVTGVAICERTTEDFGNYRNTEGEVLDYIKHPHDNYEWFIETAGTAARDWSDRSDEDDYVSVDIELNALEAWHDTDPTEHTTVLGEPTQALSFEDQIRNAYVDGADGYSTRTLVDLTITGAYQRQLLNWFVNKNLKPQVGSVGFIPTDLGLVARCSNQCLKDERGNYRSWQVNLYAAETREQREDLTYRIIAHGNNCGPDWLKAKPGYYRMNPLEPKPSWRKQVTDYLADNPELSVSDATELLEGHMMWCSSDSCNCLNWYEALMAL